MKKQRYLIPGELVPADSKLVNGEPMKPTMLGAYFGSSAEIEMTYSVTRSDAGNQIAPAYSDLKLKLSDVPRKGEFAALKGETQVLPETRFGERIMEIPSVEVAVEMKDDIRRFMVQENTLGQQLVYLDGVGNRLTYSQLMRMYETHKKENQDIRDRKAEAIQRAGCQTRFVDGKKVNPEYPEALLNELKELSSQQWSPTGYFLRVHLKLKHTIAKDNQFFTGSLEQAELDQLASCFDYKEHNSFYSGKLGRADISMPIQSLKQVQQCLDFWSNNHPIAREWTNLVGKDQIITCNRGVYIDEISST